MGLSNKRRLDNETIDNMKADLLNAIGAMTKSITETKSVVTLAQDDLVKIRSGLVELVSSAQNAASNSGMLAKSTEQLAAASDDITNAMDDASKNATNAIALVQDVNLLIADLAEAAKDIGSITNTITAVSKQTNLLALNATIEAARAGPAGRAFAVVATEVKSLALTTSNSADDIKKRIDKLRARTSSSLAAVERASDVIAGMQPLIQTVRGSINKQIASINQVAHQAVETAAFVGQVSGLTQKADLAAQQANARAFEAKQVASNADQLARALPYRFTVVMRQNEVGDRRHYDRFPVDIAVTLNYAGQPIAATTIDVGIGGMLLAGNDRFNPKIGETLQLVVDSLGPISLRVVAISGMGIHGSFSRDSEETQARIKEAVHKIEEEYHPLIAVAQATARQIEQVFESAIKEGRLTREKLFDTNYRLIANTNPQQYETQYLKVAEEILPPVLNSLLDSDKRMVLCAAVDRNGYVPTHNPNHSRPQRPGDVAWNTIHSRNKRIFDDRAGLVAARSTRPFVVQSYVRELGQGPIILREIDAPLRILDRHWGAFRMAYQLTLGR